MIWSPCSGLTKLKNHVQSILLEIYVEASARYSVSGKNNLKTRLSCSIGFFFAEFNTKILGM